MASEASAGFSRCTIDATFLTAELRSFNSSRDFAFESRPSLIFSDKSQGTRRQPQQLTRLGLLKIKQNLLLKLATIRAKNPLLRFFTEIQGHQWNRSLGS
jgi:hypothetical protein